MNDPPPPKPDVRPDKPPPPSEGEFKTFLCRILAVPKAEADRRESGEAKGQEAPIEEVIRPASP